MDFATLLLIGFFLDFPIPSLDFHTHLANSRTISMTIGAILKQHPRC